jgi:hypothetical protein
MSKPPGSWVRCEVPQYVKAHLRHTARLAGMNVPGVEAWVLGFVTEMYSPEDLARMIEVFYQELEALEKGETPG